MTTTWICRHTAEEETPAALDALAEELEISPFLARLLWQRGLRTKDEIDFFLNPGLRFLAPLSDWPGLDKAAAILAEGLLAGKKLVVWGDYDVDGITATALVVSFLEAHGFAPLWHIPSRIEEGYSLNVLRLEQLAAEGVNMILTVDCGISDVDAVAHARSLGMTVVISDHHLPGPVLPGADAICAPTTGPSPCASLAGVSVAFFLMAGINTLLAGQGRPKVDVRPLLDLVALGTLADVVDLNGQNRILVKNGLLILNAGTRPGIAALKSVCKINPNAAITAGQVVFTLAPRINAAGRLGKSETALELLLTRDRVLAAALAADLESMNRLRRSEEDQIIEEAKIQAGEQAGEGRMGLVLYAPHWHMGIIGIVASRIVEEWRRPTVILCEHGGRLKGSARSLERFDLHTALGSCSDMLLSFGGHKMAAGLSLSADNLPDFRERFDRAVRESLGETPPPNCVRTDGELSFGELTLGQGEDLITLKELEMLQPFGAGNPEPVFTSGPLILRDVRNATGLTIMDVQDELSGITLKAKLWRPKKDMPPSIRGRKIHLAYSPRIDRYNGHATIELRVRDWRLE